MAEKIGMFDVLAPGKLVLTLQSTPPFVAESVLALALTILLAAPLIVRLYFLLDKPLKSLRKRTVSSYLRRSDRQNRSLVTRYPIESAPIRSADSASSSSLHPGSSGRKANSDDTSTTLQNDDRTSRTYRRRTSRRSVEDRMKKRNGETKNRKRPTTSSSVCSSSRADSVNSIIDISDLDYRAYRHKLIEATLRKQYDDFQPPGDVVLNSLHLNTADSVIGVRLNDQYEHSLFDFVEEYYDVTKVRNRRRDDKIPDPLDYFLTRGETRPRTSEKETETIGNIARKNSSDRDSIENNHRRRCSSENVNPPLPKLPNNSADDNGNPRVCSPSPSVSFGDSIAGAITSNDFNSRSSAPPRDKTTISSSFRANETKNRYSAENERPRSSDSGARIGASTWTTTTTTRNRPSSAGSASTTPKAVFALSRAATLPERKEVVTKLLSRPGFFAREFPIRRKKSENGFPTNERRQPPEAAPGSNLISGSSSSEIASVCCSDSSSREQREDETSFRSRESSISPRGRASRPPWMSGCRRTSFNRKYGNIGKDFAAKYRARPTSAHGGSNGGFLSGSAKLTVSKRRRSNECFPAAASLSSRNPTSPERRERGTRASFTATRMRELRVETTSFEQRRRDKNLPISSRQQRDKLNDAVAGKDNDEQDEETLMTPSSSGNGASAAISADAASFLSSTKRRIQPEADFSDAPEAAASVAVSRTCATKGTTRLTSRSGDDARKTLPSARNQRGNSAKLNRDGRRRLKSPENHPSRVGRGSAPPTSSKIVELSDRVLNPTDDADKFAITSAEEEKRLAARAIDPRKINLRRAAEIDAKSNDVVARPKVQKSKIAENLTRRPTTSLNSLILGKEPTTTNSRRNANFETKSGLLNSAKLNSRSNGAAIGGKASSSGVVVVGETKEQTRGQDVAAARASGEELKFPRRDSRMGLAMNSALKTYIKTLKQALLNKSGDKNGCVALASLSLVDAISILSERKTPLSPEEIQELQSVLDRVEKHPELLCKESPLDVENV